MSFVVPDWFDAWFDRLFPPDQQELHAYTVARRLGVDKETVLDAINREDLPARPVRSRRNATDRVVRREAVREWCLASLEINRADYQDQ